MSGAGLLRDSVAGRWLDRWLARSVSRLVSYGLRGELGRRLDALTQAGWEARAAASPNPLQRCGRKFWSQNDEDGITLEIVRRLGLADGVFAEIGVGNGLENNTLILLMLGWRGIWIGAEDLAFSTRDSGRLRFYKEWVTPERAGVSVQRGLSELGVPPTALALLSVDIDSCDYDVVKSIVAAGIAPAILVVEYNAKFPPPIRFIAPAGKPWDGSDNFGCSLQSWTDLLEPAGYRLVACNVTGVNAFFVRSDLGAAFADVPADPVALFMPCDYNSFVRVGHAVSPETIARFI